MSTSVGIDLGTTFSAVAYIDPQSKLPQIIPNSEGSKLTPSVIQFLDGEIIFGSEAEDAYNAGLCCDLQAGDGREKTILLH